MDNVVDKINGLNEIIQSKKIEYGTLLNQQKEVQRQLDEAKSKCKEELGIDVEQLKPEKEKLLAEIENSMKELETMLGE